MFKWTVAIIIQEDPFHGIELGEMMSSIINLKRISSVRYVFLRFSKTKDTPIDVFEIRNQEYFRHEFTRQDLYDPETLTTFFNDHVLTCESEHYFVMTWGHGAGLGLFNSGRPQQANSFLTKPSFFLETMLSNNVGQFNKDRIPGFQKEIARFLSGRPDLTDRLTFQQEKTDDFIIMPAETLNQIFENSFGKKEKKIDFLFTMNCFMQMFETGFTLRKHVKYLIGAEIKIYFFGIDYARLFTAIQKNRSKKSIAGNVTKNYPLKYEKENIKNFLKLISGEFKTVNDSCLSVNDLEKYTEINDLINKIADYFIINKSDELYSKIFKARSACTEITSAYMSGIVDFISFCKELRKQDIAPELSNVLKMIIKCLARKKIVISKFHPALLFDQHINPHGFSIFFPNSNTTTEQYISLFIRDFYQEDNSPEESFLKQSYWDNFIRSYFEWLAKHRHGK